MQTETRAARVAMGAWWLFLVTGILWLLIALVVLRFNVTSIAAVGALLGAVFLIAGVNEFIRLSSVEGWKWLHVLLGVLFIGGSIWAFVHPIGAFYELAALLGFLLLFKGIFDIAFAVMTKEANELWWLGLVVGILEVVLAFWASQQYFAPRAALILIWVGFMAMFRGIGEIVLAFQLRKAGKDLAPA
ncbi:MAG TPA: DUF308 domain-containing protein [Actinomycetota bacterium]|nr:DUF308 domain-containing protein [Actinomycetota bacterium]